MKKGLKTFAKIMAVAMLAVLAMTVFAACTTVKVGGGIVINADGSGSRVIEAEIAKTDTGKNDKDQDESISHKFLKKHGAELETAIKAIVAEKITDSSWLTVAVDNTAGDKEFIRLSFNFANFNEYVSRMEKLYKFGNSKVEDFIAPTLVKDEHGYTTFTEAKKVTNGIAQSLKAIIVEDESLFDITAGGSNSIANEPPSKDEPTPDGLRYSKKQILDYAVESKANFTVKMGAAEVQTVSLATNDLIEVCVNLTTGEVIEIIKAPKLLMHYDFNDNMNNKGTGGTAYDLKNGTGSTEGSYVEGVSGKGYNFTGSTYLDLKDLTPTGGSIKMKNMTISFYMKTTAITETDTGANLVIVPAGLDALSPGAFDIGYIVDKTSANKPAQFLSKVNGSNWQNQDKMQTETTFNQRINEWHNFSTVYNYDPKAKTGTIALYIDGQEISKMEQYNMAGFPVLLGAENGFNLGAYYEAEMVKRGITGVLDEFKIFDGALTEAEIVAIYDANKVPTPYDVEDPTNSVDYVKPTPEKTGCGSTIALSAIGAVGAVSIMTALSIVLIFALKRKKKEENL